MTHILKLCSRDERHNVSPLKLPKSFEFEGETIPKTLVALVAFQFLPWRNKCSRNISY